MYIYLINNEYIISSKPLKGELIAAGITEKAAMDMVAKLNTVKETDVSKLPHKVKKKRDKKKKDPVKTPLNPERLQGTQKRKKKDESLAAEEKER